MSNEDLKQHLAELHKTLEDAGHLSSSDDLRWRAFCMASTFLEVLFITIEKAEVVAEKSSMASR